MSVIINNHIFSDLGKQGLFVHWNDKEKAGVFNKDLEVVIPFEYQAISDKSFVAKDGNIYFQAQKDDVWGAINIETKEFVPSSKNVGEEIYQEDDKYGIINPLGEFVVPPIYDEIRPHGHSFISTKYTTGDDGIKLKGTNYLLINYVNEDSALYGLANNEGVLVEPIYEYIEDPNCFMEFLNYPAYSVGKDDKMGYIDANGKILIDCIYEQTFGDLKNSKCCAVTEDGDFHVIDLKTKKVVFEDKIENIEEFYVSDYNECFSIESSVDNKTKVFDENGNQVAEFELDKQYRYYYLANNLVIKQHLEPFITNNIEGVDPNIEVSEANLEQLVDYNGIAVSDKYRKIYILENTEYYLGTLDSVYHKAEVFDKNGNVLKDNLYHAGIGGPIPCESLRYTKCPVLYWESEDEIDSSDGHYWSPEGFSGDETVYIDEFKGLFVNGVIYRYEISINSENSTEVIKVFAPNGELYKQLEQKFEPSEEEIDLEDDEFLL